MSHPAERHNAQVRKFYASLWEAHDLSVIPALLSPDCGFRGSLGQERRGHDGVAAYVDMVHVALADYRCHIETLVSEGDQVFAKMFFTGVHRGEFMGYVGSGKQIGWHGAALFGFDDDLIADLWVLGDVHGLPEQLGRDEKNS